MTKNTSSLEKLGERLLQQRTSLNLSQANVAARIGASQGVIAHWETGRSLPGIEYLTGLAATLEVSIEWLLTGQTLSTAYVEAVIHPIQERMAALDRASTRSAKSSRDRSLTFSGPEEPSLTPIQQALLATVTDALRRGALSDTDCVKELPRWHALATSASPAKAT